MSDLSMKNVHAYWHAFQDKMIYRVVVFMDGVERFTHDLDETFEEAIEALSQELSDISKIDMTKLGHQDLFIRIGNVLSSSRCLRFLHVIDTAKPGTASRLLAYAEETTNGPDDEAGIFLRRNVVFERLRLLGRVFAKDRVLMVTKALEGDESG